MYNYGDLFKCVVLTFKEQCITEVGQ